MAPEVQQLVLVPEVRVAPDERLAPSPVAVVEHAFVAAILIYRVSVAVTHEKTTIVLFYPSNPSVVHSFELINDNYTRIIIKINIVRVQGFVQIALLERNEQIRIKIIRVHKASARMYANLYLPDINIYIYISSRGFHLIRMKCHPHPDVIRSKGENESVLECPCGRTSGGDQRVPRATP